RQPLGPAYELLVAALDRAGPGAPAVEVDVQGPEESALQMETVVVDLHDARTHAGLLTSLVSGGRRPTLPESEGRRDHRMVGGSEDPRRGVDHRPREGSTLAEDPVDTHLGGQLAGASGGDTADRG